MSGSLEWSCRGGYARNCRNEESNGSYLVSKRIVGSEEVMED